MPEARYYSNSAVARSANACREASLPPANRKRIVSPAAAMPFKKGHKGHPRKSLGSKSRHIPTPRPIHHQSILTIHQEVLRL
jgi:hypothetical protein